MSIEQPVKLKIPEDSVPELQPDRVPDDGLVPIDKVTEDASLVIALPPASSTVTWGWVPRAVPPVPAPGWMVNTTWEAVP